MGKHHDGTLRGSVRPKIATAIALQVAGVLAVAYSMNPTVSEVGLAAQHAIFVDGTKSPFLTDVGDPADRMRDSFAGRYDFQGDQPEFVDYPGTLGLASILSNGPGAPTFDESEQAAVHDLIRRVRIDQASEEPSPTIYVVGYSQGASAVVRAITALEQATDFTYDADKVVVVLAANPRRNDGGLLTRFPTFTLPLVGATFGGGTNPSRTRIVQVTKQYDGVADVPLYPLNVVADLNAILGYVYLHGGYYQDVDIDPESPPADSIVTKDSSGRVTDILLPSRLGELPLTRPLLSLGVPRQVVAALDPFLRAIIETGYDRPANGSVTSDQPIGFKILPGPDKWMRDIQSVLAGTAQMVHSIAAPAPPETRREPTGALTDSSAQTGESAKSRTVLTTGAQGGAVTVGASAPRKFAPVPSHAGAWQPGALLSGGTSATDGTTGSARTDVESAPAGVESVPAGVEPVPNGAAADESTIGSPAPDKGPEASAEAS